MKEVKKVLGAALAATITTGIVGTVAGATTVDDLYKAAYDATVNALNKKDQESINAAREAINKLPAELQGFKGEFSKQVDTVQHPILVTIVDSINNADKSLKQVDINTARKAIPANLPAEWKNSYSTGLDAVQQKLIVKADEAVKKAQKSQAKVDVDAARALLSEIATVENNDGVKTWVTTYEKEFMNSVKLTVDSIIVAGDKTVKVNFNKEVNADTVSVRSFKVYETESEKSLWVTSVTVSKDKKSAEVTFSNAFPVDKNVTVEVKDVKDLNGKVMETSKDEFVYTKSEVASIELTKTTFRPNTDITKSLVIKDADGKDITKTTNYEFQSSDKTIVDEKGQALKEGEVRVVVVVKANGKEVFKSNAYTLKIEIAKANEVQGITIYEAVAGKNAEGAKYDEVTKVDTLKVGEKAANKLAIFCNDQYGNAKVAITGANIKVEENLNPEIAILKDGVITAISEGTANFKVKVDGIKDAFVVTVNVKAEAKEKSVAVDNANVVVVKEGISKDVKISVKDQFGDKIKKENLTANSTLKLEVKGNDGNYSVVNADLLAAAKATDSEYTFVAAPATEVGTTTYKVTYKFVQEGENGKDGKEVEYTTEFKVQTKDKADFANYRVDAEVKSLDIYDSNKNDDNDPTKGTFHVYKMDKNNVEMKELTGTEVTIEVLDKNDNNKVGSYFTAEYNAADKEYAIQVKAGVKADNYTVKVKVGDLVVDTYTLTVKDSARVATTVTFDSLDIKKDKVEVATTTGGAIDAYDLSSIVTVVDQFGKTVDFDVKENTATIAMNSGYVTKTNETATSYDLVISRVNVKIDGGKTELVKLVKPVTVRVAIK